MARFLIVVPPLNGHINPALAVAAELRARGHVVAWAAHLNIAGHLLPEDATIFGLPESAVFHFSQASQNVRGLESVRFFYENFFLPLALSSCDPLDEIIDEFKPDILITDHQMIAGALVARRRGICWVNLVTTNVSILQLAPVYDDWLREKLSKLQEACGIANPVTRPDFSPTMQIVFSSRELIGASFPVVEAPYVFVGPALTDRPRTVEFPWHLLDSARPRILISMGTVSRDRSERFYEVMMEALAPCDVQVVMVAPDGFSDRAPSNFIVRSYVPQLKLLPHLSAVVTHAGHNTVCEALLYGLPLVVAPIRDDQPIVARQVIEAGAAVSLRFGKFSVAEARSAVQKVLDDASYRQNAQRLGASFKNLGAQYAAANALEELLSAMNAQQVGENAHAVH